MVMYKDFRFVHQRLVNLIDRQHGIQGFYMDLCGVVERWNMICLLLSFTVKSNECRSLC